MKANDIRISMEADLDLVAHTGVTDRVIELMIHAPEASKKTGRPPLNLGLVIDRSGSMGGEKLDYAKQAAVNLVEHLDQRDQAALVIYDETVVLLSQSVYVTLLDRNRLIDMIWTVQSRGTTNLSGGWLSGCEQVARSSQDGSLNRTLLLTDGLANVGITDPELLAEHARELSRRGVSTSTFGVGLDFDHHLLETMSNQGGGNYHYIESPRDIPGIFAREFQELTTTAVQGVEVFIHIPSGVVIQVLGGWRTETTPSQLRIDLGAMSSGRSEPIYLKLQVSPNENGAEIPIKAVVRGKIETGMLSEAESVVVFHIASCASVEAARRNIMLVKRFAEVQMAEAANEALKLERIGRREEARDLLRRAILPCEADLAPSKVEYYNSVADRIDHGLMEAERKNLHSQSYLIKKNRIH